ncbi:OsmC family protein [Maridesulfovibrio bastinii]|uniref:OsmC family protein n=1 Tax=Maridesulfovibrio bastinii TaxID=47157 RepID=UPI0004260B3E|nr:OsmC family protein [Maridesulfovibrio bastinii]
MTNMTVDIEFGEGKKLDAKINGFSVAVEEPVKAGGSGSAPNPVELFLVSLASCAAVYARRFCESRSISTEGFEMKAFCEMDPDKNHIEKVRYQLHLPKDFPEKYKAALLRSVDLCTVKKHLINPPSFELEII